MGNFESEAQGPEFKRYLHSVIHQVGVKTTANGATMAFSEFLQSSRIKKKRQLECNSILSML